jgi:hypothetical protein
MTRPLIRTPVDSLAMRRGAVTVLLCVTAACSTTSDAREPGGDAAFAADADGGEAGGRSNGPVCMDTADCDPNQICCVLACAQTTCSGPPITCLDRAMGCPKMSGCQSSVPPPPSCVGCLPGIENCFPDGIQLCKTATECVVPGSSCGPWATVPGIFFLQCLPPADGGGDGAPHGDSDVSASDGAAVDANDAADATLP